MSRVLVTGATGQVGRHVVARLAGRGVPVQALTRDPERAAQVFGGMRVPMETVEVVQGDFSDLDGVRSAVDGCDQLFLVSPDSHDQVQMEMNVVEAALDAGAQHVVKVSSCDAADGAPYLWARNHYAVEQQVAALTGNCSFLRPHYFMQNLFSFADEVRASRTLSAPADGAQYGMIDARDIADAAVALLADSTPLRGHAELTGPAPVSFADVVAALSAATGTRVRYASISDDEFRRVLTEDWNTSPEAADDIVRNFQDAREGKFAVHTDEVQNITGHQPRSIHQFATANTDRFM